MPVIKFPIKIAPELALDPFRLRRVQRGALLGSWCLNLLLAVAAGLSYLGRIAADAPAHVLVFALLALVSSMATLALVPLVLLWPLARSRKLVWVQAVVWMFFHLGLFIDTRIYRLFGYHFNGAALNLFVTRGSEDSYRLGWQVWVTGWLFAAVLVSLELIAWRFALARALQARPAILRLPRGVWIGALLLVAVVGVEKTLYAHAEVTLDRQLTAASQVLPLYPRFSVKPFLPESIRSSIPELPPVRLGDDPRPLDLPLELPRVDARGPRPDIVMLVIDSWRADMLTPEVTPRLAGLAQRSRSFADHLSGGNGTRFGVFSMLYGLHGSYWWSVLAARRSPVLIDVLQELGYEVRVYSSASMDFPEFRSTAWVHALDGVHDDFAELRSSARDEHLGRELCAWWRSRSEAAVRRPSFTFVLLDSAHQTYDFPAEQAVFRPFAQDLDYVEMARSREPALVESVRNRYRNALHHADSVAGGLIDELESEGALEHTLLFVTGDHGEEFAENDYWGHTGNFTREQTAVPLLLSGPGVEPGVERRPTSHLDVAPTILELLGASPDQRAQWCLGESLLAPLGARMRTVAGWTELGLVGEGAVVRIPRSASEASATSVWTLDWRLVEDQGAAFAPFLDGLSRLDEECNRFYGPRR